MKKWQVTLAVLLAFLLVAVPIGAASPWMQVKFLRVLVNQVVDGDLTVGDDLTITDDSTLSGDLSVAGALDVTGATTLNSTLDVDGATTLNSTLDVDGNITSGTGVVTVTDNVMIDGQANATQLLVQEHSAQTADVFVVESSAGTDQFVSDAYGKVEIVAGADADAANYDNWVYIHGAMTGVGTKDRNYGLVIEMTRAAGQELSSGDHDEAGLKIRVDTEAVTTTAGTVLRGADIEAKADNPGGTVTNLQGAAITAKSDTSAGDVGTMWGLSVNAQNNAAVDDSLIGADVRIMRQAATEPTDEMVLRLRNAATVGTGADAAIEIVSDSSGTYDNFDYGIDMAAADVNTADVRLSNGETIDNVTDGVVTISAFTAFAEQSAVVVTEGSTITPTGTYQPITSAAAVTTSTSTAIADGVVNGQMLILVNENASDAITIDNGANTFLSGNIALGSGDTLTMMWDGANWLQIATSNNS